MTIEKIKSAKEVLTDFMGELAKDERLDTATLSAIVDLRGDSKLTKINLLRQLEEARKAAPKVGDAAKKDQ